MGFLNSLLESQLGQSSGGGIGGALLGLLSSESGGAASSDGASAQSPAAASDGLRELVQRFEQNGLGDAVKSWIGGGANQQVAADDVHRAVSSGTIDRLAQQTGMGKQQLLPLLAQALPQIVDWLTPHQRLPNETEVSQMQSSQPAQA